MKTSRAATPMAFARAMVMAYERRGLDPTAALRAAQIRPRDLKSAQARITAAQMEALSGFAMKELDDEALGWFSRRLPWGTYGMLARASMSSPTLGIALQRWCRHHRLVADDITLRLQVAGAVAIIRIDEHRRLGELREFCLVSVLRNVHGLACWAIDSRIPLSRASFPFAAPAHRDAYALMFGDAVDFDAPHASIAFSAQYLQLPLRRDEGALRAMLQRALPLMVRPYRRDRLLVQRVEALLRQRPQEWGSAEALSHELHVSARTLHRQLQTEGASLQQLKDKVRRELAIDLLCRTTRPIKQVALDAGFRSEKSFARAFGGWTGMPPSDYRLKFKHKR